ncbi:hypothetical protein PInf_006627 [Phytophthora infestans]|nr:hypothetical protein PInf_006627 [Phytophthora infestans]
MNATRYTANFMNQSGAVFVLNVPVRGMEELVLAIGSSSGSDGDKLEQLNIPICAPGVTEDDGHLLLRFQQAAIGWGFAATLATFIASPGSGAHLNPAVTLAIAVSPHSGFPKRKVPVYMLFQLLGATFAGVAVYLMFGSAIHRFEDRLEINRGSPNSAISAVAFGASFPHPQLVYGKAEESSFWSKSDACLNPARDFGPRIVAAIAGWGAVALPGDRPESCWIYLLGPCLGALAGSMLHDFVIQPGLQTRDEVAAAWMRHQQIEGEAILEQLEKSQTLLSVTAAGGFESLATRGLHHSDYRDSPTPHNFRLSSPHLHTFVA